MKKYTQETVAGIFVFIGIICLIYMAVKLGDVSLLGADTYMMNARFDKVTGLRVGNPVNMLGIEIGRVAKFTLDQEKLFAIVALDLNKDIKIYSDAIASIKTAGLIGDRYVSIDPGGSGELLNPGDTIEETESPVDLTELIGKYAFGSVKENN
jgi:phospholipid/cholesterol/gamma-HCH transport system substrate-binding protein